MHDPTTGRLDEYAVRLGGCHVLLNSRQAVLDVLRAVELSVRAAERDGLPPPRRISTLVQLLRLELAESDSQADPRRGLPLAETAEVPPCHDLSSSIQGDDDTINTEEAAQMLGVTARQMRNLAPQLGARRIRREWRFERHVVEDEMHTRQHQCGEAAS